MAGSSMEPYHAACGIDDQERALLAHLQAAGRRDEGVDPAVGKFLLEVLDEVRGVLACCRCPGRFPLTRKLLQTRMW